MGVFWEFLAFGSFLRVFDGFVFVFESLRVFEISKFWDFLQGWEFFPLLGVLSSFWEFFEIFQEFVRVWKFWELERCWGLKVFGTECQEERC